MAIKLRSKDYVIVITGKNKGCMGYIKKILPKNNKVIIEGINMVKKHKKSKIILKEQPIDLSNIAIFNSYTKKADRIGFKMVHNQKCRYYKSNNQLL